MDVMDLISRASALCAQVRGRTISARTLKAYNNEFERMWGSDNLDPLRPGVSLNTFYHRRAAVHFIGARRLEEAASECMVAIEARNAQETVSAARKLHALLDRLEPVFALDPPIHSGTLPWTLPPSRWHQSRNVVRTRAENSKRYLLAVLPRDWDEILWNAVPPDWRYRVALATLLTVPVRPEELVAGDRPAGFSPGVVLELEASGLLSLSFMPAKSHRGLFGTERTTIGVDPRISDAPAQYLAKRCRDAGGRIVISIDSKNGLRKAISKLGAKVFPTIKDNITPNVTRHQLIADLKTTFGAGAIVAAAAGHGTERTQSCYRYYQHGRKRRGYVSVLAARPPSAGLMERARRLKFGARRRPPLLDEQ